MNETIFTIGTALISFIIPVALYKILIRKNRIGRDYFASSGQFVGHVERFAVFVVTALLSFFLVEPLISSSLHSVCSPYPFSEWILLSFGIGANYFLINYLT